MSATDKFYKNPTPANAIRLAIADHEIFNGGRGVSEYTSALRQAEAICEAYTIGLKRREIVNIDDEKDRVGAILKAYIAVCEAYTIGSDKKGKK